MRGQVNEVGEWLAAASAAAAPALLGGIAGQLSTANGQASQVVDDCEKHLQGEYPSSIRSAEVRLVSTQQGLNIGGKLAAHPVSCWELHQRDTGRCIGRRDVLQWCSGEMQRGDAVQHHCTARSQVLLSPPAEDMLEEAEMRYAGRSDDA